MSTLTVALDHHAELGGAAGQMRRVGAGHQRLGGSAAGVDAGAAERGRSMIATFIPAPASRCASEGPDWPVPMMMASNSVMAAPMYSIEILPT